MCVSYSNNFLIQIFGRIIFDTNIRFYQYSIFAKPCNSAAGKENYVLKFGADDVDMDMILRWERAVVN